MEMLTFKTHTGKTVSGIELTNALNEVADNMTQLAKNIRIEDAYATHVTDEQKEKYMLDYIDYADAVRRGEGLNNFTIWQRVNQVLTGECVAFLPK